MNRKLICTGIIGLIALFVSGISFTFEFEDELERVFWEDAKSMDL